MNKRIIIPAALVVAVVGFLLFRPDKLFVDDTVGESLDEAFTTTTTGGETTTTGDAATTSTTAAPRGPQALASGMFSGIDHRAKGTATVYEEGGMYVLRFEDDTNIQNGPDLYVWVLAADSYEGGNPASYLDLGKLKGNVGGQNYELPADFDPATHRAVLIWCLRFAVPFAAAPLEMPT
jgi:hypothetical protein